MASKDPLKMDRGLLRGFERVAVPLMEHVNRSKALKHGLHATLGRFNSAWIARATGVSWRVHGFEAIKRLDAPQGILLVANHLSFFDMYIAGALLDRQTDLLKRVCFPVRANWHYQNPIGVVLNSVISGAAMWPPVFRNEAQRKLNHTGLEQMADFLGRGACIGIHPEGRHNTGGDRYAFLPLKPGVGLLAERCHPDVLIVPCFIIGLGDDARFEGTRWARKEGQRGEPIRVRFAAPLRVGDVRQDRDPMAITEAIMATVAEQGQIDKAEFGARF